MASQAAPSIVEKYYQVFRIYWNHPIQHFMVLWIPKINISGQLYTTTYQIILQIKYKKIIQKNIPGHTTCNQVHWENILSANGTEHIQVNLPFARYAPSDFKVAMFFPARISS
jgi:hypothetical protein